MKISQHESKSGFFPSRSHIGQDSGYSSKDKIRMVGQSFSIVSTRTTTRMYVCLKSVIWIAHSGLKIGVHVLASIKS